jgi:ribosomal protein L24E
MKNSCRFCKKEYCSGIWLSPQFADEKVLLFCSEKCKENYLKKKLERIRAEYPNYYEKIKNAMGGKNMEEKIYPPFVKMMEGNFKKTKQNSKREDS